jgi:hypothetical protein
MGRKGGNAKRKDQKKSVLSNVEVMQKNSNIKKGDQKEHTRGDGWG